MIPQEEYFCLTGLYRWRRRDYEVYTSSLKILILGWES